MAGILVARMLAGMQFAVGPTIVARKKVLASIGGFDRLKDYLAEDFVMGKFAAEAGHGVILSSYVIEHHIGSTRLARERGTPFALDSQHPPFAASGIYRTVVHHAGAVGLLVCIVDPAWWPVLPLTLLVRGLAAYVVSARVLKAKLNWLLLPDGRRGGVLFLDRGILRQHHHLAGTTVSAASRRAIRTDFRK